MLSFFPRGVFDEILNLIESVSEGFPSYTFNAVKSSRFQALVVLGLNDSLRQYFSLYRVVSQREGEREEKG